MAAGDVESPRHAAALQRTAQWGWRIGAIQAAGGWELEPAVLPTTSRHAPEQVRRDRIPYHALRVPACRRRVRPHSAGPAAGEVDVTRPVVGWSAEHECRTAHTTVSDCGAATCAATPTRGYRDVSGVGAVPPRRFIVAAYMSGAKAAKS